MLNSYLFSNKTSKFLLFVAIITGFFLVFEYAWELTWFYLVCVATLIISIYVANTVNSTASDKKFNRPLSPQKLLCPSCGSANSEDAVYCSNCGSSVKQSNNSAFGKEFKSMEKENKHICTSCGSVNTMDAVYCSNCGYQLNLVS